MKYEVKRKRCRPEIAIAALLIFSALLLDSKYRIVTNEYEIYNRKLPLEFDGFRIVQISDLHGSEFGKKNERLIKKVGDLSPDVIALTGDFIDKSRDLEVFEDLVANLVSIAPVYFVSGNHDWASGLISDISSILERYGATYLKNEYIELKNESEGIILAGVEDPNGAKDMKKPTELVSEIRESYPDSFVLLLGHRNNWLEKYPLLEADLILCGHGHGGIIRIPGIGGLLGTSMDFFPKYTSGIYIGMHYAMGVSRGLGDAIPMPRIFNNPHLPVIVLRKQ